MAIALVQQNQTNFNTASTSGSLVMTGAPTSGTKIYLSCNTASGNNIVTITQTNVTWKLVQRYKNLNSTEWWEGTVGGSASATINFTTVINGSVNNARINALNFSGVAGNLDLYKTNTGSSANPSAGSITPTAGIGALLLTVIRHGAAVTAATGGFTMATASGGTGSGAAYRIVTTTSGSYTPGFTGSSGAFDTLTICIAETSNTGVLHFTQDASNASSGAAFSPVISLEVWSNGSSIDTSSTLSVTAEIWTGSGTLVGTVTRAAVAGAVGFNGLGITGTGTFVIRFRGPLYLELDSASVTISVAAVAVDISFQDDSVMQGAGATIIARKLLLGVVDTSFTGNITLAKSSGSGTLSTISGGTGGLVKAAVAGVATWTADVTNSTAGLKVITATLPTAETVTLRDLYVRNTAYAVKGASGVAALGAVRDVELNYLNVYGIQVGGNCVVGTPATLVLGIPGSGHYLSGYSPQTWTEAITNSSTGHLSATTQWGARFLAEKSTADYIWLAMPAGFGNDDEKRSNRLALPLVLAQLQADGYNINKVIIVGYSTGGIEIGDHLTLNGSMLTSVVMMDAGVSSWHLTGTSPTSTAAQPYATYSSSYYDSTGDDISFFANQIGPDWYAAGCAILVFKSSTTFPIPAPGSGRDQFDPLGANGTDGWLQGIENSSSGTVTFYQTRGSSGTVVAPTNERFVYQEMTGKTHADIQDVFSVANYPTTKAWMFGQTRPGGTSRAVRARLALTLGMGL